MSLEPTVYVGAYLKVEAERVPAKSPYVCPVHSDRVFWESGFCQKCGKALIQDGLKLRLPRLWDLLPDDDDEFVQADLDNEAFLFLLSNGWHLTPDHVIIDHSDEIEITHILMGAYIRNFSSNHQKSIKELRAKVKRLTIKFGVIQYYM